MTISSIIQRCDKILILNDNLPQAAIASMPVLYTKDSQKRENFLFLMLQKIKTDENI